MNKVLTIIITWWIAVTNHFRSTYVANKCKHSTKLHGLINDGQKNIIWKLSLADNKNPDYCLNCVEKMSILCAWCNQPITFGSLITLYKYDDRTFIPKHAVYHHEAVVGCLRQNCAHEKEDVRGIWVGKVKILSPERQSLILLKMKNDK